MMSDFAIICLGAATAVNSFTLMALSRSMRSTRLTMFGGNRSIAVKSAGHAGSAAVSDHFSRFLTERTEVAPGNRVRTIDLYEAFIAWNGMSGAVRWSLRAFSSAMYDAGFRKYGQSGIWCDGIRLKEVAQ